MPGLILIQIKVEPELKQRFQALILARKGENGSMSDVIRSFMIRECEKFETALREEQRKEEEHQAKLNIMHRKANRQAS
jgi:hypothetical protein